MKINKELLVKKGKEFLKKEVGSELKQKLGLSKFNHILIQKVINSPLNIFIITVDSRFPYLYISKAKVDNIESTYLKKFKKGKLINYKLTPPIELDGFSGTIPNNGMIYFRDLAGEYYKDDKMYEQCDTITFRSNRIKVFK